MRTRAHDPIQMAPFVVFVFDPHDRMDWSERSQHVIYAAHDFEEKLKRALQVLCGEAENEWSPNVIIPRSAEARVHPSPRIR